MKPYCDRLYPMKIVSYYKLITFVWHVIDYCYSLFRWHFCFHKYRGRSLSSDHDQQQEPIQSDKSPLVATTLETITRFFFTRTTSSSQSQDSCNSHVVRELENSLSPARWFSDFILSYKPFWRLLEATVKNMAKRWMSSTLIYFTQFFHLGE